MASDILPMTRICTSLFVAPIGRLPYAVLYPHWPMCLSQCPVVVGLPARCRAVQPQAAFPEMIERELRRTARQFYTHLAEVLVESLRHFHAGPEEL